MKRFALIIFSVTLFSCVSPVEPVVEPARDDGGFELSAKGLARMFASLPMEPSHLREVYDAVARSSWNGYDEEYTLDSLVMRPGAGMGPGTKSAVPQRPLRELVKEYLEEHAPTRAGVEDIMHLLADSGYQLYWPYSEDWDGETYPVVTFDPGFGAESNYGFELAPGPEGAVIVDTLDVDEAMAQRRPVWVINSNSDAAFTPLELFSRKEISRQARNDSNGKEISRQARNDSNGKEISRQARNDSSGTSSSVISTGAKRSGEIPSPASRPRRLMLRSFRMLRNYDSWFGGASEFWVRCGSVDGFTASTDAELKLYTPSVTDFMIVVKRRNVDKEIPYQAILVTDFTNQLDKLAFLIVEDDGGTRTNWRCQASVKIQSKSYGFDIDIPYNEKDDVVWRGQISARFFEEQDVVVGRFGDVICSFELD